MLPAVFLDRDDTLIHNDGDLGDPEEVRLLPGVPEGLRALRSAGFRLVVVTNQGGVARGRYTEEDVDLVHRRIAELVDEGAGEVDLLDRFYYCPYHPDAAVAAYRRDHFWRKPRPGMLLQAARDLDLDLGSSWLIGDRGRDIEAGRTAGCRTVLLSAGGDAPEECRPSAVADDFMAAVQYVLKHAGPRPAEPPVSVAASTRAAPAAPPTDGAGTAPPANPGGDVDVDAAASLDQLPAVTTVVAEIPVPLPAPAAPAAVAPSPAKAPATVRESSAPSATPPRPADAPRGPVRPRPAGTSRRRPRPTGDGSAAESRSAAGSSVSAVSDQTATELRQAIGELVEEVRAERMRRGEFGGLRLAAGLLQLLAVLFALLGVLQTGTDDAFFRWMAGAGLVQLAVIALLVADSRA